MKLFLIFTIAMFPILLHAEETRPPSLRDDVV